MKPATAPGYDLFKTIVAVILAILLILMLLRGCAVRPALPAPTQIIPAQIATQTLVSAPVPAATTAAPEVTRTLPPSATPAEIKPTATPTTAEVTPTSEATEAPTATPEAATSGPEAQGVSCNTSVPSRLSAGQMAKVIQRLNMRRDASIRAPILQTNAIHTRVEIIGGPVCTPVGQRAYLWWQIRLASGAEGWSAESPLNEARYFLEPVP